MGDLLRLKNVLLALLVVSGFILQSLKAEERIVDLGQYGSLFDIKEEDMLDYLMRRLNTLKESGKIQEMETNLKNKAKERVLNPLPVEGLSETRVERSFIHDPSLVLDEDIKDHEGRLIARAGQRVNPLQHLSLSKGMVFVDGREENQVQWAIEHQDKFKIVLTNGSPLKRQEQFGTKFYFDQGGIITKRYGIRHVPARFEQEGDFLRVTEFVVTKDEDSEAKGSRP